MLCMNQTSVSYIFTAIHVLMSYMSNINKGLPFVWHKTVFKLLCFNNLELLFTQHF